MKIIIQSSLDLSDKSEDFQNRIAIITLRKAIKEVAKGHLKIKPINFITKPSEEEEGVFLQYRFRL
jgi:hypothetical protein